jgi:UDP-N-acetylglucosamine 2-epimerase
MKILSVIGTRPEIIKMAPLIWAVEKKFEQVIVHSGQHYDKLMSDVFIEQMRLPRVDLTIDPGSGTHAEGTARMVIGIEKAIASEKPDIVLCPTDTNTSLATALASTKLGVFTIHVEAGCRSFDMTMPEEINRRMITHSTDFHFASTPLCRDNLVREGISPYKIAQTGNPIADAISFYKKSGAKSGILSRLGAKKKEYGILTFHRQENTDNLERAKGIIDGVANCGENIIFPMHPRTKAALQATGLYKKLQGAKNIKIIDPIGYFEMLELLENSKIALTDSGGLQQEAYILGVPSVVLRYNTEWYDIIKRKCGILAGAEKKRITEAVKYFASDQQRIDSLFAESKEIFGSNVSEKMVNAISSIVSDKGYKRKGHDMIKDGYYPGGG